MGNHSRLFKFFLFVNVLILMYSAYQVKVNDSKLWGYTFIGVFLWTVGVVLVKPVDRTPRWYRLGKLLDYPLLSLVIFALLLLAFFRFV